MTYQPDTFALTLEDAEFVVEELPQGDGFTLELRAWVDEQREERERSRERAERFNQQVWYPFLWNIIEGIHGPELAADHEAVRE